MTVGRAAASARFGVIGMGVMGRNFAYNLAGRGVEVVAHDPWPDVLQGLDPNGPRGGPSLTVASDLSEFVASLEPPRKILLLVKAGEPTEAALRNLVPLLEPGDIVIDGGNTHYKDTSRRAREYRTNGLDFVGAGVSGGAQGALEGPSIMLGGSPDALDRVSPLFDRVAARVDGSSCFGCFGPEGAGHFVKMVHNGIEYAEMQVIAEAYSMLSSPLGLSVGEISDVFARWNQGPLESYLFGVTAVVLRKEDPETGMPLVERVLDTAGQKGTGRWTAETAIELGVPVPSLVEAVIARGLSALKTERHAAADYLPALTDNPAGSVQILVDELEKALLAARFLIFAQGFSLFRAARQQFGWPLPEALAASVWRGGCIIRARQLEAMKTAFSTQPDLVNLLLAPNILKILNSGIPPLRRVVVEATRGGIPVPAFGACLAYYDAYRSARLPANLIQAQRDCFGAHGYERIDRPGTFHTDWTG